MNKKLYFRQLRLQFRPFLLMSLVLCLAEPIVLLTQRNSVIERAQSLLSNGNLNFYNLVHAQYFLFVAALFLSIMIPFVVFHFLYKKSDLDNYYSMPVKRKVIFRAHFFFGWTMLVAMPLLLSALVRYLINYLFLGDLLAGHFAFSVFFLNLLALVLGSFILYLFTCIAIFCTTNLFNGLIYTAAIHSILPFLALLVRSVQNSKVGYLPPQGAGSLGFTDFLNFIGSFFLFLTNGKGRQLFWVILFWAVISIPVFFLAQKLFSVRKAERVNGSYMFKAFYPSFIGIFGVTFLTQLLTSTFLVKLSSVEEALPSNTQNVFSSCLEIFIGGLIIYMIVQLARYHGKPPVLKKIGSYVLLFAISIGLSALLAGPIRTRMSLNVPSMKKVDHILLRNVVNDSSTYLYFIENPEDYDWKKVKGNKILENAYKLGPDDKDPRPESKDKYVLPTLHKNAAVPSTALGESKHYEEVTYKADTTKELIQELQKETVKRVMNGDAKEFLIEVESVAYSDTFYSAEGEDRFYTRHCPLIQIIYYDKEDKIIGQRELPIFKSDRQKAQKLFNGKFFYDNGILVKKGDL